MVTDVPAGEITLQAVPLPADPTANGELFCGWSLGRPSFGLRRPVLRQPGKLGQAIAEMRL